MGPHTNINNIVSKHKIQNKQKLKITNSRLFSRIESKMINDVFLTSASFSWEGVRVLYFLCNLIFLWTLYVYTRVVQAFISLTGLRAAEVRLDQEKNKTISLLLHTGSTYQSGSSYSFTLLLKYSYFCFSFIWSLDTDECWFRESLESKSIDIECIGL